MLLTIEIPVEQVDCLYIYLDCESNITQRAIKHKQSTATSLRPTHVECSKMNFGARSVELISRHLVQLKDWDFSYRGTGQLSP
jgi:hypothetical protein